jgi:hypothetical protein
MAYVTLYRSAHPKSEEEAHEILNMLREAGVGTVRVRLEEEPGSGVRSCVVDVDDSENYDAQAVLQQKGATFEGLDAGASLDFRVVFFSDKHDAENEALAVKSLLEANGISTFIAESSPLPNFPHKVLAARADADRAREIIHLAQATGPMDAELGAKASAGTPAEE